MHTAGLQVHGALQAAGLTKMAETIDQFVVRRRRELDHEIRRLEAELEAIRRERTTIDNVASSIGLKGGDEDSALPLETLRPKTSELTIKALVLNALRPSINGMSALDILAAINEGRHEPFARTSLSPQLSRLKSDGQIHREGRIWKIGRGTISKDESEDTAR